MRLISFGTKCDFLHFNSANLLEVYCSNKYVVLESNCIYTKANFNKNVIYIYIYIHQGFLHRHWQFTGQQGNGGAHLLFHSTASTRSWTLRHSFATLHVRWLSRIFNRNACVYQTATRWVFPPYRITIWVIDW